MNKRKNLDAALAHVRKMADKKAARAEPSIGTPIQGKVYRKASIPGGIRRRMAKNSAA